MSPQPVTVIENFVRCPISLWCKSSLGLSNKVIDLLPPGLLVEMLSSLDRTAFLRGWVLFPSRVTVLFTDALLPPPLWALALLIFWFPGSLTGTLRGFCWIWPSPFLISFHLFIATQGLSRSSGEGHPFIPGCCWPCHLNFFLSSHSALLPVWLVSFDAAGHLMHSCYVGHCWCLCCVPGDSRYCVWTPDLPLLFLSTLIWSIFRPLSRLKPFPHLPTLVVPSLWIIVLLSLISGHNSCLSFSLLSFPTTLGVSQWIFLLQIKMGPSSWRKCFGQALASSFWSSLDKREKKVTMQTNRKQSKYDKSNFRACQQVNWSDAFLPTAPKENEVQHLDELCVITTMFRVFCVYLTISFKK